MKRKAMCAAATIVVIEVLIGFAIYFKPLSFSGLVGENSQVAITINEFEVKNGKPYIDSTPGHFLTSEQKNSILGLLEQYTYKRTFATPFSDGSLSELGNRALSIYVYDDGGSLSNTCMITSSGKIRFKDKTYHMKNADQLIEQVVEMME